MFHRYQHQVKSTVDPEKLVVFNVKQGWYPLCPLAVPGIACPDSRKEPFPYLNNMEGGLAKRVGGVMEVIIYTWPLLLIGILGFLAWLARLVLCRAFVAKETPRKVKAS